nr:MAG: ORF1 [TTV-like mini virus]UGV38216.1 MAG: ORF1 [TTV-like mini virus]UGV38441.1 MAG: ORF1 [TTV-like mini virus]UGV38642.1 MAG: ORF1 [TTV-like mini virus]UGV38694.1 MAG: ORF1 [TTV-like mini virus]
MPPFRRYYYWNRRWRKRPYTRRWIRYRRPGQAFRRRIWRKRRRPRVRRKRQFSKKLTKLIVKEFQPKTIRYCNIKGFKCLAACGPGRESNNYAQFITSIVPEKMPMGGGWSQIIFSLASLFEDNNHYENIWTQSNAGLNLVRYLGIDIRFYQHPYVDYVVVPRTCYPMTTSPLDHANAQPYRTLLERKKIIIPSVATKPLRKRSRKVRFKPPSQLTNHWYFQKNLCNTPFLMLTTTAVSLPHMFLPSYWWSNNITITCLNTHLFTRPNFAEYPTTTGYRVKNDGFLWTSSTAHNQITDRKQLIKLANTKDLQVGTPITQESENKAANWGNPFSKHNLDEDIPLFYSQKDWSQLTATTGTPLTDVTLLTDKLYVKCRYCPEKDTGEGNTIYWVKNYSGTDWDHPENFTLKIEGLPLWLALWGWIDYTKKVRTIQRVNEDHILVFKTNIFAEKLPAYVPIDESFRNELGPYNSDLTNYDKTHWYPQTQQQFTEINRICMSGPATPKPGKDTSFDLHCRYKVRLKWGGCPETLEKVYDPCSQQVYPVPSNFLQTTQINDPASSPTKELYTFDFRREMLTKRAAERITKDSILTDSLQSITDRSKSCAEAPKALQEKDDKTQTQKEKKEKLLLQLLLRKRDQLLLKHRIFKLTQDTE